MVRRETRSWLLLAALGLMAVAAADYGVFVWRQRHGDVLSYTTVKQYVAVTDAPGHWHLTYFGAVDIPCVVALLPHQRMNPCWWVRLHHDDWQ